eukprot:TRINITY_DN19940_c0_g1_i1.p1 TRINITY_DN19940_c0_g1~~TRINITY_DN19940_c0_g1_i1.p1  ORF type:complete len:365 (+),score=46.30 TRINITY_DN19940_c0_g1_i1:46-1095(+)
MCIRDRNTIEKDGVSQETNEKESVRPDVPPVLQLTNSEEVRATGARPLGLPSGQTSNVGNLKEDQSIISISTPLNTMANTEINERLHSNPEFLTDFTEVNFPNDALEVEIQDVWQVELCIDEAKAKTLVCQICNKLPIEPKKDGCGHIFCQGCILSFVKLNKTCPISKEELSEEELGPVDSHRRNSLHKLRFVCPNDPEGCRWSGTLRDYEDHAEKCEMRIVKCPYYGCNQYVEYSFLSQHKEDCQYRTYICEICKSLIASSQLRKHREGCLDVRVVCGLGCRKSFPKSQYKQHTLYECPKRLTYCDYWELGCTELVTKECFEQHCIDYAKEHREMFRRNEKNQSKSKA